MQWLYSPLYADLPPLFWGIFVFIGAAIGSFFNVLALRWGNVRRKRFESTPIGQSNSIASKKARLPLMAGRSHCPICLVKIPIYHNIPLISWLVLKGRSACCKQPISPIYLLFEAFGASVFLLIALTIGPTAYGMILGILAMSLSLMLRIFLRDSFVPEGLLVACFILAALTALGPSPVSLNEALAWLAGMLVVGTQLSIWSLSRGSKSVELHDILLLGMSGLLLGVFAICLMPLALIASHLSGQPRTGLLVSIMLVSVILLNILVVYQ